MRVLIVDDEAIARRRLVELLGRVEDAVVVGEADDGADAIRQIEALSPDVVLLDIAMPVLDGMRVAKACPDACVIFTTAYDEHAVEAFTVAATDYLLKPVELPRLRAALERAARRLAIQETAALQEAGTLVAQHGRTVRHVDPRLIRRIYSEDKLSCFQLGGRDYHLRQTLNELESQLRERGFVRCNRGELVNVHAIEALRSHPGAMTVVLTDGSVVPVSRRRAAEVRRALAR